MTTDILWSAQEAAKATGGTVINGDNWQATALSMDSREVEDGHVFIALKGGEGGLDGHDYIAAAIKNGAVAAIVDHETDDDIPQVIVADTFKALQDLGQFARRRAPLEKTIAITGSVGKTGTRDMVATAFRATGKPTHASIKSYNNHVGVPFTLANMPRESGILISEIGMNHAGEIAPLAQQVAPDIAVITNISEVHIEYFNNGIDGIIKEKSEIFKGVRDGGAAVLPRDNPHYAVLKQNATDLSIRNIYSFGEHHEADAHLIDYYLTAEGSDITADIMGDRVSYRLQIAGKHIGINSLITLLCVKLSNGDVHQAAKALESIQPLEGRGQRELIHSGDPDRPILLINEYYNASPVAMKAALEVLGMTKPKNQGRRIAVLGDMRELGDKSRAYHESLAEPLHAAQVDILYCCCPYMKYLYDLMPETMQGGHFETAADLGKALPDLLRPDDVVLVKGSLGSKMKDIITALRAMTEFKRK